MAPQVKGMLLPTSYFHMGTYILLGEFYMLRVLRLYH